MNMANFLMEDSKQLVEIKFSKMIEQLKQKMKSKGVTAYRLSKITGISRSTIGRIVKYECDPLLSTYSKLMDALN